MWRCVRILLAALLAGTAVAEPRAAPYVSVEAVVDEAQLIVIGRIVDQTDGVVTIDVEETLKGNAMARVTAVLNPGGLHEKLNRDRRLMWLGTQWGLINSRLPETRQALLRSTHYWVRDRHHNLVNLDNPDPLQPYLYRLEYQGAGRRVLVQPLKTSERIMAAVREQCARPKTSSLGTVELKISPASRALEAVSANYLRYINVPIDARLEAPARQWVLSDDPYDRWNGAAVLGKFESDQNVALISRLLNDPYLPERIPWPQPASPGIWNIRGDGKWDARPYPVRALADRVLRDWDRRAASAIVWEPKYPARYPRAATVYVTVVGAMTFLLAIIATAWLWRGRFWAGVSRVSLLVMLAATAQHFRSQRAIDEIAFRGDLNVRWEIASFDHSLRVIRFRNYTETMAMEWTSVSLDDATRRDWMTGPEMPRASTIHSSRQRAGFAHTKGDLAILNARSAQFTMWKIPLWAIVSVFAILPVTRMGAALRRMRRKKGYCPQCGYDLRATPQRCPECGFTPANQTR